MHTVTDLTVHINISS